MIILGERLRKAKDSSKEAPWKPDSRESGHLQPGCLDPMLEANLQPISSTASNPSPCNSMEQVLTTTYELPYPLTVSGALFINGQILGLSCCATIPAKSSPVLSNVPIALHPTPTQLLTVHFSGIDRFPFPKMRDNAINMSSMIDEEEFTGDLFTMPSFHIIPGGASWDPSAWRIERPFAEKWGFLFY
jgi:Domain of unknown function (DUF3425)